MLNIRILIRRKMMTCFKSFRFEAIQVSRVRSPIPHLGSQEGTYAEACEGA